MMRSFHGAVRLAAVLSVIVLATSCYRLKPLPGQGTEVITDGSLDARVEFAVAPIVDLREDARAPLPAAMIRKGFSRALVERRYSPLSLDYVDAHAAEAGYEPGAVGEDAVLQITVEEWDDSLWEIHRALNVTLEVVAIDPNDPAGALLWKARTSRRFDKAEFGDPNHQPTEPRRLEHACKIIAGEVLAALPPRTEEPGRL